ncbi:MAG: pentapeptide repeat-containing protein [Armatimonadota bacterium]
MADDTQRPDEETHELPEDLRDACLDGADLRGADLSGAELHGASLVAADLRGADLRRAWIGTLDIRTESGHYATHRPTILRGADLRGALLTGIRLEPEPDLSDAIFDQPLLLDERCARDDAEWERVRRERGLSVEERPTFADCEAIYRQLKLNYQESGEYTTAGDFFVREMECKRTQLWATSTVEWLGQTLFYWLSGYGERPIWVLRWMAGVVLFFAWVQGALGLYDGNTPVVGPGIDWLPSVGGLDRFVIALYFSMVTFTSLGYGDLRPADWWLPRLLSGGEAMIGLALMALLVVSFVRKFSR